MVTFAVYVIKKLLNFLETEWEGSENMQGVLENLISQHEVMVNFRRDICASVILTHSGEGGGELAVLTLMQVKLREVSN